MSVPSRRISYARGPTGDRRWPRTCLPAAPRCPRRCPTRRTGATPPPIHPASAPASYPPASPTPTSTTPARQPLWAHTSVHAAAAHPPLVAAAHGATPYGHDHDATPSWHTTHQESLPSRPYPPADSGPRSPSSRQYAAPRQLHHPALAHPPPQAPKTRRTRAFSDEATKELHGHI